MKFCKDCKHHHPSIAVWGLYCPDTCHGGEVTFNPVTGDGSRFVGDCSSVRAEGGRCGPEGKMFDPKNLDGRLAMLEND